jgi:hypothetical protein
MYVEKYFKKHSFMIISVILILFVSGCAPKMSPEEVAQMMKNVPQKSIATSPHGFEISYYDSIWTNQEINDPNVLFYLYGRKNNPNAYYGFNGASISIKMFEHVGLTQEEMTESYLSEEYKKQMEQTEQGELIEIKTMEIDGSIVPIVKYLITVNPPNSFSQTDAYQMKTMSVSIVKDNQTAFLIYYSAFPEDFDELLPSAENVISSFKVIK